LKLYDGAVEDNRLDYMLEYDFNQHIYWLPLHGGEMNGNTWWRRHCSTDS